MISAYPPRATTSVSASLEPHTWALVRRTPHNSGFIPDPAPFPHRVRWTYSTTKPLLASPAVVEHHVYLTTGDGRTIALDRHTGQPVWEYHSGWPSSSTPAVAGDVVIFAMRPGRVVALHRQTGARRWETDLRHPILASPIVVHGTVYIGAADKQLYALDAATGRQRWAFAAKDWIVSAVAYADDRVIVASQHSRVHVVGAETGRQRSRDGHGAAHRGRPSYPGRPGVLHSVGAECGPSIGSHDLPMGSGRCCFGRLTCTSGYALESPDKRAVYGRDASVEASNTGYCHNTVTSPSPGKCCPDAATGRHTVGRFGHSDYGSPDRRRATVLVGTKVWSSAWMPILGGAVDFKTPGDRRETRRGMRAPLRRRLSWDALWRHQG